MVVYTGCQSTSTMDEDGSEYSDFSEKRQCRKIPIRFLYTLSVANGSV